MLRFHGSAEQQ